MERTDGGWGQVVEALAIAADEAEQVIAALKQDAKAAIDSDRYSEMQRITETIEKVRAFIGELDNCRRSWIQVAGGRRERQSPESSEPARRRNLGRVRPGDKTSEDRFHQPILEALVHLGGSGTVREVLDIVEAHHASDFKASDRQVLPSSRTGELRWRNTCQWARHELVVAGLLKGDSPRGQWQISDSGRAWLIRRGA